MVVVIDHHGGRLVALREALHLDDGELPVRRRLARLQVSEALPALGVNFFGAVQVAGDRRADLNEVLSDGRAVVHRVERHDSPHEGRRQLEKRGDVIHGFA
jgi:hypothetical protein